MANDFIFKDIDLNFSRNIYDDIAVLTDADAIKKSVVHLVMTNFEEKLFLPQIGTDVNGLLFENYDISTISSMISDRIKDCIRAYEKRVDKLKIKVEENIDQNALNISIAFTTTISDEIHETNIVLKRLI